MTALLALAPVNTWGILEWCILIIALAATFAVVYLVLDYFGYKIPPIVLKIIGIVLLCIFAIFMLKVLWANL